MVESAMRSYPSSILRVHRVLKELYTVFKENVTLCMYLKSRPLSLKYTSYLNTTCMYYSVENSTKTNLFFNLSHNHHGNNL